MTNVLLLSPPFSDPSSTPRVEQLVRALVEDGHRLDLVYRRGASRRMAPGCGKNLRCHAVDRLGFENPETLSRLLEKVAPEAIVAVSLAAARTACRIAGESPLWIDFPHDLLTGSPGSQATVGAAVKEWESLAPVLDRGDYFSCGTERQWLELRALLGLRGRFGGDGRPGRLIQVLRHPAPGNCPLGFEGRLAAWIREPHRANPVFQGLAQREALHRRRADSVASQLAAIRRSKAWRLWIAVGRSPSTFVGFLKRGFEAASGAGARGLRRLWYACGRLYLRADTGRRRLVALWRRRRGLVLEEDTSVDQGCAGTSGRRPRVLIVSPYPIFPINHGGASRLYNLVKQLGQDCDLFLLIFIRDSDDVVQRAALEPYCQEIWFHHWQPQFDRPLGNLLPPNARIFASPQAEQRIFDIVKTHGIDVLQLEYTELAQYHRVQSLNGVRVRVILVEHDVAFRSFARRLQLGFSQRFPSSHAFGANYEDWMRLLRYEVKACRKVDQIHVMSPQDGAYLASFLADGPRRMRVVPNAVDTAFYHPPEAGGAPRRGVLLVGNFENLPNLDAFEYFTTEIWPRVRELRDDVELSVVGAKMPSAMHRFDGRDGIRIVGEVPDMRPIYHRHRVMAVPLRAGSGTRLKLFEAFAAGIPAVSTSLGAEGIDCTDGTHLIIADTAADFVQAIGRLLDDDALCAAIAEAAMRLAREKYDWSFAAQRNLAGIYELVGSPRPATS